MTRTASITSADLAQHAARGRRLQSRAVRAGFGRFSGWLLGLAAAAIGRRATVRLGCGDCGAHA